MLTFLTIYFITFCSYLPHCPIFILFLLFFLLLSPPLILPTRICIIFFLFSCYRNTFIFESRLLHEKEKLYLSCGWVVDIAKAKSLQRPYAKCKKAIFLQGPEQEVACGPEADIEVAALRSRSTCPASTYCVPLTITGTHQMPKI